MLKKASLNAAMGSVDEHQELTFLRLIYELTPSMSAISLSRQIPPFGLSAKGSPSRRSGVDRYGKCFIAMSD